MVRYEMQRRASENVGSTMALVGHASMHSRQFRTVRRAHRPTRTRQVQRQSHSRPGKTTSPDFFRMTSRIVRQPTKPRVFRGHSFDDGPVST